jgi:hypothetical protein
MGAFFFWLFFAVVTIIALFCFFASFGGDYPAQQAGAKLWLIPFFIFAAIAVVMLLVRFVS